MAYVFKKREHGLAVGADGAVFGTRFIASHEAAAHPAYRRTRIIEANARDTLHTTLFDIGWPDAPHRVLRTKGVERWEAAGRPRTGQRPGEGVTIAHSRRGDVEIPLVNYTVMCRPITSTAISRECRSTRDSRAVSFVKSCPLARSFGGSLPRPAR